METYYPDSTIEAWALDFVLTSDLETKLRPSPAPRDFAERGKETLVLSPGRNPVLRIASRGRKTPGREALRTASKRAEVIHTFMHHELQAAELMCWAILAFPNAPQAFRTGLVRIAQDEMRHVGLYREHLGRLGCAYGDFPVRDWFWTRMPSAATPAHFVAGIGVGLEGGSLDHAQRFVERFEYVGDSVGADIQRTIVREEIPHVRFALHWFRAFMHEHPTLAGADEFDAWLEHLPRPLSPLLMHGRPMNLADRLRAGFSEPFLEKLARWSEESSSLTSPPNANS